MKRELKSWKWLTFIIAYEMIIAYVISLGIYQLAQVELGTLLTVFFSIIAVLFVATMVRKFIKNKGRACGNCEKCSKTDDCGLPKFIKYKENIEGGEIDDK
jgi:hypothetical protein